MDCVRRALRGYAGKVVLCETPDINWNKYSNVRGFESEFKVDVGKHHVARKPELYAPKIYEACRMAREYCELMCLTIPLWATLPKDIEPGEPLKAALRIYTAKHE